MHGWLGKIQWQTITWKRRFLQFPKHERSYWCRLQACEKSLERIWNKKRRWIPLFVCSEQYIITSWCIWKLLNYMSSNILTWPGSFSFCTWISVEVTLKTTKVQLELLTNIDMLLMVEKGIRGGICHATHQYANDNNIMIRL